MYYTDVYRLVAKQKEKLFTFFAINSFQLPLQSVFIIFKCDSNLSRFNSIFMLLFKLNPPDFQTLRHA